MEERLICRGNLIKWEDFLLQLEPEEIEAYGHIKFTAGELGEPQEVTLYGVTIGLVYPSGAFQQARRIDRDLTLREFTEGWR